MDKISTKLSNKFTNYYNNFCQIMQENNKGTEIAIYAASGILFAWSCYKIRPFTKFGKPADIPIQFIQKKLRQRGTVKGIENNLNGLKLLVDHKPPLNFLIPFKKFLPVQLAGVSVNANGYSWLQSIAVNHDIEFIPISKDKADAAECQVFILCPHNKKNLLDISESLLSLGMAKIIPQNNNSILSDIEWKKYYKYLNKIEKSAQNDRVGLWLFTLPPKPWPVRKAKQVLNSILLAILPAGKRLPVIVR